MCHHTERDTFKLEPIIEVSLVPFLLDTEGRGGERRMCVCPHIYEYQNTISKVGPFWLVLTTSKDCLRVKIRF